MKSFIRNENAVIVERAYRNSKTSPAKCVLCNSVNARKNISATIFCGDCHYCVTRKGNVSRTSEHPLYQKLGYKIKKNHEDNRFIA